MGTGDWLRYQTEHRIMAVRGKPTVTLTNQTTVLHAPMRGHSEKPKEFYDFVEKLCPAPRYADLFSRYGTTRSGIAMAIKRRKQQRRRPPNDRAPSSSKSPASIDIRFPMPGPHYTRRPFLIFPTPISCGNIICKAQCR